MTKIGYFRPQHCIRFSHTCIPKFFSMVGVPKRVRGCESCKKRRLTVCALLSSLVIEISLTSSSAISRVHSVPAARKTIVSVVSQARLLLWSTILGRTKACTVSLGKEPPKHPPARSMRRCLHERLPRPLIAPLSILNRGLSVWLNPRRVMPP